MTTLRQRIANWLAPQQQRAPILSGVSPRNLVGGRVSMDSVDDATAIGFSSLSQFAAREPEQEWRDYSLDSTTLDRVSPSKLMELLADLSPDVSRALWDFNRMFNPGWEVKAYRPGSDKIDEGAQKAVDEFLSVLKENHGSVDVLFSRFPISLFLRGAILVELVLDEAGKAPVDIAVPDPTSVKFERFKDERRGLIWRMFQWQNGQKVYLDLPTISYVPVDPFPGKPHGRPLASPALFTALFLLGLLHDLRRVVAQQGYPRLDFEVVMERLQASMPQEIQSNPVEAKKWADEALLQVQNIYASLKPDDAFVHPDFIKVNRPVGAVDSSSLGGIDGLIQGLERMSVRALKTMPLMMGMNDGVSEANANRQWEVYAASVKALQHLCEQALERMFGLALQAQGIQAVIEFRFSELRAAEEQRDALTQSQKLDNARKAYDNGLISQDEQADMALGKEKADAPAPRSSGQPKKPESELVPEPGSNRSHRRSQRFTYQGMETWREPSELEKRVKVENVAGAMDKQKLSVEGVLLSVRDALISDAVDALEGMDAADYHTLVLNAPKPTVREVRKALEAAYKQGRELVDSELKAQGSERKRKIRTILRAQVGIDSRGGFTLTPNGNGYRATPIDDKDVDELDEIAATTVSRLVNDVQSRAIGAAADGVLMLSGAELWNKVRDSLSSGSTGFISTAAQKASNVALSLGRSAEFAERAEDIDYFLWSSILDRNLCSPCGELDGKESSTESGLPDAPYSECEGGALCRCFVIAVSK